MWRENEIRCAYVQQRVAVDRRLLRQHIKACAGNHAGFQRGFQRLFINQTATRRIDQQGAALHLLQLRHTDEMARLGRERAMQADDVGFGKHTGRVDKIHARGFGRRMVGKQDLHAQGARNLRRGLAEHAFAEYPQGAAVQVLYRMVKETELLCFLPAPVQHIVAVGDQVAPQCEYQRKRVFGHGMHGVIADIGHSDAAFTTGIHIDHVIAGGGHGNQFEVW